MENMQGEQEGQAARNASRAMTGLAEEMIRDHGAPMPDARSGQRIEFPGMVFNRFMLGIGVGSILGLMLGILLYQGIVLIPQAEELYSMGPVAFHSFWIFKGITAGMVCFGIWGIIAVPD